MQEITKTSSSRWRYLDLYLVLLTALVPLLWFHQGELLKGEDLRLPYTWEQWKQLFFMWHHGINTGSELIFDNALIPMMFLPAFLQKCGLDFLSTQKFVFVFWFLLPGFSMAYLLRTLIQGEGALVFRISALSFYLFNLWLENIWIGFKPPLITAYALVPLLLALILKIFKGEMRLKIGLPLFFFVSFLASGAGNNPSEFGTIVSPGLILLGFIFVVGKTWKNPGLLRFLLARSLLLLFVWLLANLYWFLPQCASIYRNLVLNMSGEIASKADLLLWLNGVSQTTSFSNVIRTLGDWTWYQGCVDPYRSYSSLYTQSKTFFYFLSWVAPLIVLIGFWNKSVRYRGFFLFLTLTGVLLSMGSHPPFGSIYIWLTNNVPLFWIFRSPYLKFYLWVCLGYSILFGAGCHLLYKWSSNKKFIGLTIVSLLCLSNLVYAFPLTTGKFFHSQEVRTFLSPNRFKIPEHVFDVSKWIDSQPGFFRTTSLPSNNPYIYEWGGANYGSFLKEFSQTIYAFPYHHQYTLIAQGAINQSKALQELIRDQIYSESTWYASELLALLQIKYLIHEKDIRYDFYQGLGFFDGDSPEFIENKLHRQKGLIPVQEFGPWQIYENQNTTPYLYGVSPDQTYLINGPLSILTWWSYINHDKSLQALIFNPSTSFASHTPQKNHIHSRSKTPLDTQTVVLNSTDLDSEIIPHSEGNVLLFKKIKTSLKWDRDIEPVSKDKPEWYWWNTERDRIILVNKGKIKRHINLSFNVFSYESPRSFYFYNQDKNLKIVELKADQETEVRLNNLVLPPGKTELHFYSPYAQSRYQGKHVRFAIQKDSFKMGLSTYRFPLSLHQPRKLRVRVYPLNMLKLDQSRKRIWVNTHKFSLEPKSNDKKNFYEGIIDLPEGTSELSIEQTDPRADIFEFTPLTPPQSLNPLSTPKVSHQMSSPTKHKAVIHAEEPFTLIFSESFHPYWRAYTLINGKKHFFTLHEKANGFANGYWIDQTGDFEVILEFTPQRFFVICLILTALSILFFLGLLFSSLISRKQEKK